MAACLKAEDFADGREALRSVERVDSLCIRLHALAPIAGSGGEAAVPDQAGPDNEEGACITIGELLKLPHEVGMLRWECHLGQPLKGLPK